MTIRYRSISINMILQFKKYSVMCKVALGRDVDAIHKHLHLPHPDAYKYRTRPLGSPGPSTQSADVDQLMTAMLTSKSATNPARAHPQCPSAVSGHCCVRCNRWQICWAVRRANDDGGWGCAGCPRATNPSGSGASAACTLRSVMMSPPV